MWCVSFEIVVGVCVFMNHFKYVYTHTQMYSHICAYKYTHKIAELGRE